jgi:phosphoglycolate phosphatase
VGESQITLACLDLAGTTVADDGIVERAFAEAIATQGIVVGTETHVRAMARVHNLRGRSKMDIFRGVFPADEAQAQAAHVAFERSYDSLIDRLGLAAIPGAEEAIEKLTGAGIRVCLMTGFSSTTLGRMIETLGWWGRVDLVLCPADVFSGRGRPWPDLILTAALRLRVDDVRHIAVCGDTDADMVSGRRAGASIVAGVLTGAHDKDRLVRAGATHMLASVADLPDLVLGMPAPEGAASATGLN